MRVTDVSLLSLSAALVRARLKTTTDRRRAHPPR